ncbi:MAG: hypothetical protein EAX91_05835 [Candidatus Lokiarchaeota archaeon]|nr:hypothetical protein [Candidatus Lokiarchaeota archaeon]
MSIDKWLDDDDTIEKKKKREELYNSLSTEEKKDLKRKKIRDLVQKAKQTEILSEKRKDLLNNVIAFKEWLDNRTYIKGDIERIETWVKNLYYILRENIESQNSQHNEEKKKVQIQNFNSIPINFLDEKTRIALNKKLKGINRTNSDNYYLRKLKSTVREKIKEAEYYEILRDILES